MATVRSLDDNITKVPLVGNKYAEKLKCLGIETVRDLLFHVPVRYEDNREPITIRELIKDGEGMILGEVGEVKLIRAGRYKIVTAEISDETGVLNAKWFNQVYMKQALNEGQLYFFKGKIKLNRGKYSMNSPEFEEVKGLNDVIQSSGNDKIQNINTNMAIGVHLGRITPVYACTNGVSSKWLRSRLNFLKENIEQLVLEPINGELLKEHKLLTLAEAVKIVHFPEDLEVIAEARRRLAFDELLRIMIKSERMRRNVAKLSAPKIKVEKEAVDNIISFLPYNLTKDQRRVLDDILTDIKCGYPMKRLLDGDVGSGKTIVIAIVALFVAQSGYDAVLLAPTTILAQQHYKTFQEFLQLLAESKDINLGNINVRLLTSASKLSNLAGEDVDNKDGGNELGDIIIGTHAILHDQDVLNNVGFVVVDEQHRFGVEQREKVAMLGDYARQNDPKKCVSGQTGQGSSCLHPHYVNMTATPIPRSLVHVLYGDMDVSFIRTMPKERKEVKTYLVSANKRSDCMEWIQSRIVDSKKVEQAFVVYPLIEDSEKVDAQAAVKRYEELSQGVFSDLNVGLLHGRLSEAEKDEVLMKFRKKEFNVLVSTSVVEVGIDIPDATIMVIESAERFGLAQLHQLRGRVGRSNKQSYCYVITGKNVRKGGNVYKRLNYFADHNSGFDVANYDLHFRGPGEVYGYTQSGIPKLKVADIMGIEAIEESRNVAIQLLDELKEEEIKKLEAGLFG